MTQEEDYLYIAGGLKIALAILTDEQFEEYQRQRREEFMRQRGGSRLPYLNSPKRAD